MNRRTGHNTTKSPRLTGGDDRPRPACEGRADVYDVLIDQTAGPAFHAALRAARDICGGCPLMTACLNGNRDEQWARSVLGVSALPAKPKQPGRINADRNRERAEKLNADRLAQVRRVVAANGTIADALRVTKTTHDAFYTWCRRRGHLDLWATLNRGLPRKRARVASCGTESGYLRHRRQGERPCEACYAARNESQRVQRERRKKVAA